MSEAEQAVLDKLGTGGRTHQIGKRMGWTHGTTLARRYLLKLEKRGLVRRNEQYSAVNDIYWEPVA